MLVKFMTKGKPTLVNVNHICGIRMDTDQKSGAYMTKIFLSSGQCVFVDESMNVVHQIINQVFSGKYEHDYSYDVPTLDEKFQSQYNRENELYDDRRYNQRPRIRQYDDHYENRRRY